MSNKIFCVFLVILLFVSCKKNTKGFIRKDLSPFDIVELNSNFDIFLIEDTVFYIEISGFEKSISQITSSINSGVLLIDNLQKMKFMHPKTNKVTLFIHSKPLTKVIVNETCDIKTVTPITSNNFIYVAKSKANFADFELNCVDFGFWNNYPCGGQLILKGKTDQLKIWNTAIMSVNAKSLQSNYAYVENSAKAVCELRVSDKLDYKILNDGNIDVYGSPKEINMLEKSGNGELIIH